MNHLTVHIALDDQTVENRFVIELNCDKGCLHYIPGSHKWQLLPITSRHFNDMDSILEVLDEDQKKQ
jgi:ectoine hydroxylase-related dioxygenase (phytanoyl-CoA dioxygenase family)